MKAYRWLAERYEPVIAAIPARYRDRLDDAQLIYEFIEHRNALSREPPDGRSRTRMPW